MKCRDMWICLCAYLMDGEPEPEKLKALMENPDLCPKCRKCSERARQREIGLQKSARSLIQERIPSVMAPVLLRESLMIELERAEEYRESGIEPLGLIRWGTHIAYLYRSDDEMAEVLVPYIEKGLEDNELCACMISEMAAAETKELLTNQIPDLQKYIDTGQLQLLSHHDWYLPNGSFDVQEALDGAVRKYQEALANGYSGLRVTGNIFWLDESDWDSFMHYEDLLDEAIQGNKALVICMYKETECTIEKMVDIVNRHNYVIRKTKDSWQLRKQ